MNTKEAIKYPKQKAELSLQFYYDKDKVINFMITSQGGNLSNNNIDFYNFGCKLAKSDLFSIEEKHSLRSFCVGYIAKLMGITGKEKETILGYFTNEEWIEYQRKEKNGNNKQKIKKNTT